MPGRHVDDQPFDVSLRDGFQVFADCFYVPVIDEWVLRFDFGPEVFDEFVEAFFADFSFDV